jgi:hypothetical protein
MLVSVRAKTPSPNLVVHVSSSDRLLVSKDRLVSAVQMLHNNETCVLANNNGLSLRLINKECNHFVFVCSHRQNEEQKDVWHLSVSANDKVSKVCTDARNATADSISRLLHYTTQQMLPEYKKACAVSLAFQSVFGSLVSRVGLQSKRRADDVFVRTNACTISKIIDIFNATDSVQKFSASSIAKMVWLAAVFCANAPSSNKGSLFHASQLQMSDMPERMAQTLKATDPQKQHITMLMRGESVDDRIRRFNLAVRVFSRDSEFCKDLMPALVGLNEGILSPVVVVSGVRNRQAAAIFLSSHSLTPTQHSLAMDAYMCGVHK